MIAYRLLAICIVVAGCQRAVEPIPAPVLKEVDRFRREAYFVAKDSHIRVLNVSKSGEPRPVFQIPRTGELNSQVAVARDQQGVFT